MGSEREKKRKKEKEKDKDKEKPPPQVSRPKSRASRSQSKVKRMSNHDDLKEEEPMDQWDEQEYDQSHDLDFGNAPQRNKKKKSKKGVAFDTYLDNIESDKLKITKGGRMVAMDYFTDSLYIISSNGFSSGKHEWEIKTLKTGDLADEIGVCSDWGDLEVNGNGIADMGSSQLGARAVYANDPSTGVAFHDAYDNNNKLIYDKKFKKKGSSPSEFIWGKGDIIKVALNSKQVGKSIALHKDLSYYPFLCAYGSC